VSDAKLKSYVERVKTLIEQQKTLGADITQLCRDAKEAEDFEPAMIRFAARELLMDDDKRTTRDDKRHRYLHAVGLAADMVSNGDVSLREAAKVCGVSKSSVHRALAVPALSQDVPDFEYVPIREMAADDLGDPLLVIDKSRAQFKEKVRSIAASVNTQRGYINSPQPQPVEEDTLEFPPFLRRVPA
jgi:uncharacterized protein (UPF0335 family)